MKGPKTPAGEQSIVSQSLEAHSGTTRPGKASASTIAVSRRGQEAQSLRSEPAAPEEVIQVVQSVFATMLALEASPTRCTLPDRGDLLTAAVYLTGIYKGAVLIHCLPPQACGFTGRFLGMSAPSQVDDDVRDVLGELANMVAGNLKWTFMPGTQLSMPSVVEGMSSALRICGGAQPVRQTAFATELGPVWISQVASIE